MKKSLRKERRLDVNNPLSWPSGKNNFQPPGNLKALILRPAPVFGPEFVESVRAAEALQQQNRNFGYGNDEDRKDDAYREEIRFRRQRHALTEQCNYLQNRLIELEELHVQRDRRDQQQAARQLASSNRSRSESRQQSQQGERGSLSRGESQGLLRGTSITSIGKSFRGPFDSRGAVAVSSTGIAATMGAIDGIADRIDDLQLLFQTADPLELRNKAVTKLAACIRGYLARARLTRYLRCMAEWRWIRCQHVVTVLDKMLAGQTKLDARIGQKQAMMGNRLLRQSFTGWKTITRKNSAQRVDFHHKAIQSVIGYKYKTLMKGFLLLYQHTVGTHSNNPAGANAKQLARERRLLAINIRHALSASNVAKGLSPEVTTEEFRLTFRRHMVVRFAEAKRLKSKGKVFGAFVAALRLSKWNEYTAAKQWFNVCAGLCFQQWVAWSKTSSQGLGIKQWKASRPTELRYNPKKVAYFARLYCIRWIFRPWKAKQKIWSEVTKRRRNALHRFALEVFRAFKMYTKHLRRLRIWAIQTWKGYAAEVLLAPFTAWASHVKAASAIIAHKTHLAMTYRKWKLRQLLFVVVQRWRHQALFGRTDGMYTRQMMAHSLKHQKAYSDRVEKLMLAQTYELAECKELIEREISKRRELEDKLQASIADIHKFEMLSHSAEVEVKRLEGVVDQMALINPRQVEHLKKLQTGFRFKERTIVVSTVATGSAPVAAGVGVMGAPSTGMDAFSVDDLTTAKGRASFFGTPAATARDGSVTARASFSQTTAIAAAAAAAAAAIAAVGAEKPDATQDSFLSAALAAASAALAQAQSRPSSTGNLLTGSFPGSAADITDMFGAQGTGLPPMTKEDEQLLERAKWLIARFQRREEEDPSLSNYWLVPESPFIDSDKDSDKKLPGGASMGHAKAVVGGYSSSTRKESNSSARKSSNMSSPLMQQSGGNRDTLGRDSPSERDGSVSRSRSPSRSDGAPQSPQNASAVAKRKSNANAGRRSTTNASGGLLMVPLELAFNQAMELRAKAILSACMLIGFVDFLADGDLSYLSVEDRRDWTRHILKAVKATSPSKADRMAKRAAERNAGKPPRPTSSAPPGPHGAGTVPVSVPGSAPVPGSAGPTSPHGVVTVNTNAMTDKGWEALLAPPLKDNNSPDGKTGPQGDYPFSSPEGTSSENKEEFVSPHSWRVALMQLRGMFPGAGNYSGVGVPLDKTELLPTTGGYGVGNGMYARLLEMRHTQDLIILRKQAQTERRKAAESIDTTSHPSAGTLGKGMLMTSIGASDFNVYAGNLSNMVGDGADEYDEEDDDHDLLPYELRKIMRRGEGNNDSVGGDDSTDVSFI